MERISLRMFALGIFICLAVWAGAAQLLQIPVVPSPELVLIRLAQKFPDTIAVHAGYSLMRIMVGLFAAVVAGYPIGVLMGYFPRVNRLLAPILYLSYPIPKIALLPVVMLLFGVGETSKLLLVFLIIVFQVVVAVRDAVAAIPSETYFPLRVLRQPAKEGQKLAGYLGNGWFCRAAVVGIYFRLPAENANCQLHDAESSLRAGSQYALTRQCIRGGRARGWCGSRGHSQRNLSEAR